MIAHLHHCSTIRVCRSLRDRSTNSRSFAMRHKRNLVDSMGQVQRLVPSLIHNFIASVSARKTHEAPRCSLLSSRVTGARSLEFHACPPTLSRPKQGEEFHERVRATFERPAFPFLFPARDCGSSLFFFFKIPHPSLFSFFSPPRPEQTFIRACARVWPG